METDSEWTETTDGGGAPIVEKRVGDFWLSVQKADDDSGEWDAFVDVLGRFAMDAHADRKRLTVRSSYRHASRAAAHASASAMLREIVDPIVATARAEAALAEREACAEVARNRAEVARPPEGWVAARGEALGIERTIRARTTPATLSTETLAAIAEARGLRVVEPEMLAGIEPPVLRWENNNGHWSAFIGPWRVTATEGDWTLCVVGERGFRELIYNGRKSDLRDNRLAAEAALRSLGVPFVVEEGGAL